MHEISPVLLGTFDSPDYAPAKVNFTTGGRAGAADDAASASGVDPRRYTRFDRSTTEAGSIDNFGFGDFLDLINPLQHIPIASSVYRAVTGEKINPVSRLAGDMLYGGLFGIGSAVMGGIGAAVDGIMEASTGKDAASTAVAMLFGGEEDAKGARASDATALASAEQKAMPATASAGINPEDAAAVADAAVLASAAQTPQMPQTMQTAQTDQTMASAAVASSSARDDATTTTLASAAAKDAASETSETLFQKALAARAYPLDRARKRPFGGVMSVPSAQTASSAPGDKLPDMAEANRALSAATGNSLRIGDTIHAAQQYKTARAARQTTASAAAASSAISSAQSSAETPSPSAPPQSSQPVVASSSLQGAEGEPGTARHNPIPQALMDDMMMLKALGQYKSIAAGTMPAGTKLDVTN